MGCGCKGNKTVVKPQAPTTSTTTTKPGVTTVTKK